MKLSGDFFTVLETSVGENGFSTIIELNVRHIVYTGHFPGHPVTPGVIQMQMVHELLEHHFSGKLILVKMPQCKFLKVLDPNETSQLKIQVDYTRTNGHINVNAQGGNGMNIFFKLKALYQPKLLTGLNT